MLLFLLVALVWVFGCLLAFRMVVWFLVDNLVLCCGYVMFDVLCSVCGLVDT